MITTTMKSIANMKIGGSFIVASPLKSERDVGFVERHSSYFIGTRSGECVNAKA